MALSPRSGWPRKHADSLRRLTLHPPCLVTLLSEDQLALVHASASPFLERPTPAPPPADRRALATYYRERAEQMRSMAEHHEMMAKTYHGKIPQRRKMEKHCSELVALYGKMEAEYLALAKEHDEAAKQ